MKLTASIVACSAVLATAGGVVAAQAFADPNTPSPAATAAATATATKATPGTAAGIGWFYRALTDVQRHCLADANLQRPQGRLSDSQVKELQRQVQAALASCDVEVPARATARDRLGFRWAALSSEQQQCLAEARLTRPLGRLTDTQRAEVRQSVLAAAQACGVR